MQELHVEFIDLGPACEHNLMCWICNKNPAVYQMNEDVFFPCRECQKIWHGSTLYGEQRHPVLAWFARKFTSDRYLRLWSF